jgi:acyl-CoA thioester hydrolase
VKEYVLTTRPRYHDVDRMGVVHHMNYISYFEVARTELMRAAGLPYTELERRGFFLVITGLGVRYRAGAGYDEELRVRARVTDLGRVTVRFEYRVENVEGKLLVEGFTDLACVDRSFKPTRLPEEVARLLA